MNTLLLIEDSFETFTLVQRALTKICDITWEKDFKSARAILKIKTFEIILLDIELPDGNGIDFCSEINSINPNQVIFLLTAHTNLSEKVLGFTAGADDYITKPFEMLELKARIESKFKKIANSDQPIYKNEILEINKNNRTVSVKKDNVFIDIQLTPIEFQLMVYLCDSKDMVIPRDELLNEVWGKDIYVYSRSVDTHISKLRKKLGEASYLVKSIHGVGYKFSETQS